MDSPGSNGSVFGTVKLLRANIQHRAGARALTVVAGLWLKGLV